MVLFFYVTSESFSVIWWRCFFVDFSFVHPFRRIHFICICMILCFKPQRHIGGSSQTSAFNRHIGLSCFRDRLRRSAAPRHQNMPWLMDPCVIWGYLVLGDRDKSAVTRECLHGVSILIFLCFFYPRNVRTQPFTMLRRKKRDHCCHYRLQCKRYLHWINTFLVAESCALKNESAFTLWLLVYLHVSVVYVPIGVSRGGGDGRPTPLFFEKSLKLTVKI